MSHSPEPWQEGESHESEAAIWCADGKIVGHIRLGHGIILPEDSTTRDDPEANLKRILACINAMKGIEDPERLMDAVRNAVAWRNDMEDASGLHDLIESISECLP